MMKKNGSTKKLVIGFFVVIISVIGMAFALFLNNSNNSNDVVIEDNEEIHGLRCEDMALVHPVVEGNTPSLYKNIISAIFNDDELFSISYRYEGIYDSEGLAKNAEAAATAQYNIILTNKYDENIGIFSHNFTVDQTELTMIITANVNDVSSKTAPYFLLDSDVVFPRSFSEIKSTYESKGMTCTELD